MDRFVFGPVPSRRLGFSLGVDIIPRKYCTLDCVYCQVGKTTKKTTIRSSFYNPDDIVDEIVAAIRANQATDFVTFSGSGEPTLNMDLGAIIRDTKKRVTTPVAVITNGSLLAIPDVRRDLMEADLLMPSLDAVTEEVFFRINRPAPSIKLQDMIEGLKALRGEYRGQIWLEIMFIKNVNDAVQHIELLKTIVESIGVDRIQLNTVSRPPCEGTAKGISESRLYEIRDFLGANAEVICVFEKAAVKASDGGWEEGVLAILKRRSLTCDDVIAVTGVSREQADSGLRKLVRQNRIRETLVDGVPYYLPAE